MVDATEDSAVTAEVEAELDESKVSSDLHTAPRAGGMYRQADGSFTDADGKVLTDGQVKRAEKVQKIVTKKREKEALATPVNTGMAGVTMTQAEFDAKVAAAVAAALSHQGAGTGKPDKK
jgi:hypothetical protein